MIEKQIHHAVHEHPLIYGTIGTVGVVLLWRGIWIIADDVALTGWESVIISLPFLFTLGISVTCFFGHACVKAFMNGALQTSHHALHDMAENDRELKLLIRKKLDAIELDLHDMERNLGK